MNENAYSEFANVDGSNVQVFAMQLDGDKLVWSIGGTTGGVGAQIGDSTANAVNSLKQLKQQIDGAVKFMNERQKKINDEKAKSNDEPKI
jgi:hypothetical protein